MPKVHYRSFSSELRKKDEESRKVTFVASTSARDAAGTILNQDGWDLRRFNSNGIIGYQHDVYGGWSGSNPDKVIGKGRAYVEDGQLLVDIEFEPAEINELADKIYKKILFGSLKAVSVGFLPLGKGSWGKGEEAIDGKNPTYYYAGQELLEVSVVNIPSNPEALKKALDAQEEELQELRKEAQEPDPKPKPEPDPADEVRAMEIEMQISLTQARVALLN